MPLTPGTKLGDCEILGPLGVGGMGEVYRARDLSLGREVAIKVLPGQLALDPDRLRRFEQEARAAAALNHPNILAIYRFGTHRDGTPYEVTELLQGQTLRDRLKPGLVPVRKTIDYALQIARGLAAAHDRGIVHRDLKPENLFITRDGLIKILDFGLAKFTAPDASGALTTIALPTEPGMVLGTAGYMSPEQVRGQASDHRSDLFSLGAILYEMLSGNRAFQGATAADAMSAVLKDEPEELFSIVRNLPPALGRIVHRCLEKNPDERFQSARDLTFNLELLSRDDSGSAAVITASPGRPSRRLAPLLWMFLLLVTLALGFAAGKFLPGRETPREVVLKRLTDFVGMEEFPAFSPDGKSMAFTADAAGRRQIWVRLLAGGAPLQVTHDDADHQSPRWSADSTSLTYFSPSADPNGQGQVWEVSALGGTARPIVRSLVAADLSHDGKQIAYFQSTGGQTGLAVAERDGSNPRFIAKLPGDFTYSNLRWSPDGRMLGYQAGRTFDYDVFYVPVSGGQPQRVTNDGNPEGGFSWLPDNSGVVVSSSRGDTMLYMRTMNLWVAHLGSKDLRQLTFGETSYLSPDIDREGNVVASRTRVQFDIWKVPVDGTPQENVRQSVQITHQTGAVQTPSAAPNGQELVYLSDSGGHGNLWILNLGTLQSRQLTFEQDPGVALGVPVWSPDSQHIAYVLRGKAGWNVDQWVVNVDGSNPHKVSEGGGWACWSPDGKWLYVSPPSEGGFRIDKVSPDGSQLTTVQNQGQKPAIGPDGTLYYVVSVAGINGVSDMEIHVVRRQDSADKMLARIPGSRMSPSLLMQPVLSPDGRSLAVQLVDGPTTNIWALATDSGRLRPITDFGNQATFIARRVSWSPDGKFIYAAVGKGEADIVLLSNLRQ